MLEVSLLVILLGVLPALYLNLCASVLSDLAHGRWGGADFTAYYTAARLIREGESPYDAAAFSQEARSWGFRNDRPYIYPPLLAIVTVPLAPLPPQHATCIWFCMNAALLILSSILLTWTLEPNRSRLYFLALLTGTLTFYPVIFSIFVGQANTLILVVIALAFYLSKRGRESLAGIALALPTLVKFFPFGIALYFLWKRKYRIFLCAVLGVVLLTLLSVLLVGLDPHRVYLRQVLPSQFMKSHPLNQSLPGFIARMLPISDSKSLSQWRILSVSASALVVLATVIVIPPGRKHAEQSDLEISLVIVALLLTSTISWIGTLSLLIIPYAVIFKYLLNGSFKRPWGLASLALLSLLLADAPRLLELRVTFVGGTPMSPWLSGLPMYGMTILWLTIVLALFKRRAMLAIPDTRC